MEILRTGTPADVRAETKRILQSGVMDGGKFVLREGNNLAPRTPPENVAAMYEACKESGLAQTGDNVQRKVTYICNCCSCCCGMVRAIREFNLRNAIVSSNWIMEVDPAKCKGCGLCVSACRGKAISLHGYDDRQLLAKIGALLAVGAS